MLIKLLLIPIWNVVDFLISIFPENISPGAVSIVSEVIGFGLYFLPLGFWIAFITSVTFWLTTSISWAIIEFVIKKIPGVS